MSDTRDPMNATAAAPTGIFGSAPQLLPVEDREIWATSPVTWPLPGIQDNWRVTADKLRFVNRFNPEAAYRYIGRILHLEQVKPGRLAGLIRAVAEASVDKALLTLQILDDIYFSRLVRFQSDIHQVLTNVVRNAPGKNGVAVRARALEILARDRSRQPEFQSLVEERLARETAPGILAPAAQWAARQFTQGQLSRDRLENLRLLTGKRLVAGADNTYGLQQAFLHLHQTDPAPAPPSPKSQYMIQSWLLSTGNGVSLIGWAENTAKISRDGFWNVFTWETFTLRLSQERNPDMRSALWNGIGYLNATMPAGALETQFIQWLESGKLDHEPHLPHLVSRILGSERGRSLGYEDGLSSRPSPLPPARLQHLRQQARSYLAGRLTQEFSPTVHAALRALEPTAAEDGGKPLVSELMERFTDPTASPSAIIGFYQAERHRLSEQHRFVALETMMSNHYRRSGAAGPQPLTQEEITLFQDILNDLPRRSIVTWLINREQTTPLFSQYVHLLLHRLAKAPDPYPPNAQTPSRYVTTQLLASLPPQEAEQFLNQYPNLNHAPQPVSFSRQLQVTFTEPLTDYLQPRQHGCRIVYEDNLEQDPEAFAKIRTTPAVSPRHHFLATWFAVLEKANQDPPRHLLHLMHTTRSMPIDDLQTALLERASTISTWRPEIRRHLAGFLEEVAHRFTGERAILAGHLAAIMESTGQSPRHVHTVANGREQPDRRFPNPGKPYTIDY